MDFDYEDVKTAGRKASKYRRDVRSLIRQYRENRDDVAYAMIGQALLLYRVTHRNYQYVLDAYADRLKQGLAHA